MGGTDRRRQRPDWRHYTTPHQRQGTGTGHLRRQAQPLHARCAHFAEQGLRDLTHSEWFAFFLPPRASADMVNKVNAALKTALASKEVIGGLATFGLESLSSTPAELADLLKRDTAKWAPIVKSNGFTADT